MGLSDMTILAKQHPIPPTSKEVILWAFLGWLYKIDISFTELVEIPRGSSVFREQIGRQRGNE